jgi:hypothetical protein
MEMEGQIGRRGPLKIQRGWWGDRSAEGEMDRRKGRRRDWWGAGPTEGWWRRRTSRRRDGGAGGEMDRQKERWRGR